jgi:hypothetical protein
VGHSSDEVVAVVVQGRSGMMGSNTFLTGSDDVAVETDEDGEYVSVC